jgi:malonyl-CoA decarboxylase
VLEPTTANCAIFYSITNCQEGLRGVTLGDLLIKQVAEDLGREMPRVRTFATLSPIPGFRRWLLTAAECADVSPDIKALAADPGGGHVVIDKVSSQIRDELRRLCAYYLLHAKLDKAPLDPVARFHLANGARLDRLNWLGDTSESGMRRSLGLMVNYVYRLADVERNHEAYARNYTVVASHELRRLARQAALSRANGTQG